MRMDVVAEGVENFEQVMYLRELGIRSAQGYVFAPPLPGKAFLQLVEAMDALPLAAGLSKAELAVPQPSAQGGGDVSDQISDQDGAEVPAPSQRRLSA